MIDDSELSFTEDTIDDDSIELKSFTIKSNDNNSIRIYEDSNGEKSFSDVLNIIAEALTNEFTITIGE